MGCVRPTIHDLASTNVVRRRRRDPLEDHRRRVSATRHPGNLSRDPRQLTQTTVGFAPPYRIDRLNNRMNITPLLDQTHRRSLVMRRRSVFKGRRVRRRRVSAGITASIANLTESDGTFEATGTESDTSCSSASPVVSSTNSFQRTPVSARGTEVGHLDDAHGRHPCRSSRRSHGLV